MNKLNLEQMKRMSADEIVEAYKMGYGLESSCKTCGNNMTGLNPATCPGSIPKGTTKTLTLAVTIAGTEPYTLKFYVDAVQKTVTATWDGTNKRFTWNWTFNETVSATPHTYAAEVVDSCATPKTSNRDLCSVTITAVCPTPVVALTIPT